MICRSKRTTDPDSVFRKLPCYFRFEGGVLSLRGRLSSFHEKQLAQEAVAGAVEGAATNKTKFATAWGAQAPYQSGLGSVMFVKGETAYNTWRDGLLAAE